MSAGPGLIVDYCGEQHEVQPDQVFDIGREADLVIDENPYLHRRFLRLDCVDGLWRISNLGARLSATISDEAGLMQAWLAPNGTLPLAFPRVRVWFTAGPTTYEFSIDVSEAPFAAVRVEHDPTGATTVGRLTLTTSQRLLLVALAEPLLR